MGSNIPLVALQTQQQPSPLDTYGKIAQLSNLINQGKLLPGQLQAQQQDIQGKALANTAQDLENQKNQQQLKDTQGIGKILYGDPSASPAPQATPGGAGSAPSTAPSKVTIPTPDPDRFASKLQQIQDSPDISYQGKLAFTNQITEMQQKRQTLDATTLANEEKVMSRIGQGIASVASAAPEDQAAQYILERNALARDPQTAQVASQLPPQYPGPDQLKAIMQRYTSTRDMVEWAKQNNEAPGQKAKSGQEVQPAAAPTPQQLQNATRTLSTYSAIPANERAGLTAEINAAPDWETLQKIQSRADASQQTNQLHQDTLANTKAIMGNKFGEAGLTANEKIWTDPQRGYAGALAQANQTKASIVAGADGNGLLTNLVPTMEVLGVNHAAGINRISPQEAIAAGTNPEWATRWNAWATKAATGKLTPEMAKQGNQLMDIVSDAAYKRSVQSAQLIARGHGLTPDQVPAMTKDGQITTLDQISGSASPAKAPAKSTSVPHVIQLNGKQYQYKGSGDTADIKNYSPL